MSKKDKCSFIHFTQSEFLIVHTKKKSKGWATAVESLFLRSDLILEVKTVVRELVLKKFY
jgi:hypothetical protein